MKHRFVQRNIKITDNSGAILTNTGNIVDDYDIDSKQNILYVYKLYMLLQKNFTNK